MKNEQKTKNSVSSVASRDCDISIFALAYLQSTYLHIIYVYRAASHANTYIGETKTRCIRKFVESQFFGFTTTQQNQQQPFLAQTIVLEPFPFVNSIGNAQALNVNIRNSILKQIKKKKKNVVR